MAIHLYLIYPQIWYSKLTNRQVVSFLHTSYWRLRIGCRWVEVQAVPWRQSSLYRNLSAWKCFHLWSVEHHDRLQVERCMADWTVYRFAPQCSSLRKLELRSLWGSSWNHSSWFWGWLVADSSRCCIDCSQGQSCTNWRAPDVASTYTCFRQKSQCSWHGMAHLCRSAQSQS